PEEGQTRTHLLVQGSNSCSPAAGKAGYRTMASPLDKGARRLLRHVSRLTRPSNPTFGPGRSCLPIIHLQPNTIQRTSRQYSTSPPNPSETKPPPARWNPTSRSNL